MAMSWRGVVDDDGDAADPTPGGVTPKVVRSPFTVLVDSREQRPYAFDRLYAGPAGRSPRIEVATRRCALQHGDYGLDGWPGIAIERKSKEDLYGSVSQRRENFVERLDRMEDQLDWAAVVVECEWAELLSNPPAYSKYSPKSLSRTLLAWMQRYRHVHWIMAPSRDHAESFTYRLLERYYLDHRALAGGRPLQ